MIVKGINHMRIPWVQLFSAVLAATLLLTPAHDARAQTGLPTFEQVPLTADMIKRFVASYPELRAVGKKYEGKAPKSADGSTSPIGALTSYLQLAPARAEMQAVLARHGFDGFADWVKVAQSIAMAYGFAKSGTDLEQPNAKMEQALSQIENNPRFTAEQKKQMSAMLQQQMALMLRMRPSAENLALVRKMMAEISAVMDSK